MANMHESRNSALQASAQGQNKMAVDF